MKYFLVTWPEPNQVKEETIRDWAEDAISNGEIDGPASLPTEELARQLHDAGLITWFGGVVEK
jgi:hypothetical protein